MTLNQNGEKENTFLVVGAGLPRTGKWGPWVTMAMKQTLNIPGTMSTRAALRILLQGDIYHMMCVGKERPDHHPLWRQALNKTITKYVRKSIFGINNIVIYLEMDGRH